MAVYAYEISYRGILFEVKAKNAKEAFRKVKADLKNPSVFERYIYRNVRRNFPKKDGWKIELKKPIRAFKKDGWWYPDYVVYRGNERVIVDAKNVRRLELRDIDKTAQDKRQYKARRGIIYVTRRTQTFSVKGYADKRGIEIRKVKWEHKL